MTAVQWLVKELGINDLVFSKNMPITNKIFQQAKEMEKQQIIDAHENGYKMGEHIYSEQYYNDKFNK